MLLWDSWFDYSCFDFNNFKSKFNSVEYEKNITYFIRVFNSKDFPTGTLLSFVFEDFNNNDVIIKELHTDLTHKIAYLKLYAFYDQPTKRLYNKAFKIYVFRHLPLSLSKYNTRWQ